MSGSSEDKVERETGVKVKKRGKEIFPRFKESLRL